MRYMVVDRTLVHLDESHATFRQRRQLIGCPPGSWRSVITVLFVFSLLPWIQRINPSPASSVMPLWFAILWTGTVAGMAFQLRRWRRRRRAEFLANADRLGAEIDVGACTDERGALGTERGFTVRFSVSDGSVGLTDQDGAELERLPQGCTRWREHTAHSFPWADANEGDPHDRATIYLLVRSAPSEDLDGRFIVIDTAIGDPELDRIRLTLRALPVD